MKILVDALGGDNAPAAVYEGAAEALKKREDLLLVLHWYLALLFREYEYSAHCQSPPEQIPESSFGMRCILFLGRMYIYL